VYIFFVHCIADLQTVVASARNYHKWAC